MNVLINTRQIDTKIIINRILNKINKKKKRGANMNNKIFIINYK